MWILCVWILCVGLEPAAVTALLDSLLCLHASRHACTHGEAAEELLSGKLLHHPTLLSDAGVRVLISYLRALVDSPLLSGAPGRCHQP